MKNHQGVSSPTNRLGADLSEEFFDQLASPKLLSVKEIDMWDTSINKGFGSSGKGNMSFDLNYLKCTTQDEGSTEFFLDKELEKSFFSQKSKNAEVNSNSGPKADKQDLEANKFSPLSQTTKASMKQNSETARMRDETFERIAKNNSKFFTLETNEVEKPQPCSIKSIRIRKTRKNGCNCRSSNCLRLHCACFKDLGYCKPTCRCYNCLNSDEHKQAREFVIEKIKYIYSDAFANHNHAVVKDEGGNDVKVKLTGCNCKTGCSLNYCDCKKINSRCSYICKCTECVNNKLKLEKDDVQKFYKPKTRKKHKILINYSKPNEEEKALAQVIEFKAYTSAKNIDN